MSDKSIEYIFRTLSRRHGYLFKIIHDDESARKLWWRDLAKEGITDAEVMSALDSCRICTKPPSLGDFILYCKTVKKPEYYLSLPSPERNRENEINHFKQMRIKLGMLTE